jgi:hypothetical protein
MFLNPPPTPQMRYTMGKIQHYPIPLSKFTLRPKSSLMRLIEVTVDDLGRPPNVVPTVSLEKEQ